MLYPLSYGGVRKRLTSLRHQDGAPYPDGTITHTYDTTDPVQPRITATYTGRYSLDGGPWRPLGIDVEVTGNPITLTPTEYTTELVQPPT